MEVQDFAPHMLLARLLFKEPSPAVIDQRGALIATLRDTFGASEFSIEGAAVEALGSNRCWQYRIGTAQVLASIENFDELEEVRNELSKFFKLALGRLESPRIAQIHVRTYDMAPTDSFSELRDALATALAAPRQHLADVVGKPLSDAGWVMEFHHGDPHITIRFGPMKIEQIKKLQRDQRDDRYPEECLFLELDSLQTNGDLDDGQALARLPGCIESNRKLLRRVTDWLTEALSA